MSVSDDIERLSRRRQELWAGAPEVEDREAEKLALRLDALYEVRRTQNAEHAYRRTRESITAVARVEREIDKLAGLD